MTNHVVLRFPTDDDPELMALVRHYVVADRRYLTLLHGNLLRLPSSKRRRFTRHLRRDAEAITDHDLGVLLSSEWRSRLTAAWLIAASRRTQFVGQLGELLVSSQLVYAGQGLCLALAADGGELAAERLVNYLDVWLLRTDCRYDQNWAMAGLVCLDARAGSGHAARFLVPDGEWQRWARDPQQLDQRVRILEELLQAIEA